MVHVRDGRSGSSPRPGQPRQPHRPPLDDLEAMRERSGLPPALRLLAGVGALAFVLIGVNLLVVGIREILQPRPLPGLEAAPRA
ncbi:MAG: hypothetical protein VKI83_07110 [Synechococcaceae cyanobacterium]|nr:hypothetical protein [Synechococcaceae cyanobacterium]